MSTATQKQQQYALDLLRKAGVSADEVVDGQTARKWRLPQGDTVRETVKVLTAAECSRLIDSLKEAL